MSVHGHYWTVAPLVASRLRPHPPSPSEPFRLLRRDPEGRELPITGYLTRGDQRGLLILVHGLGGSAESPYLRRSCRLAHGRGLSVLRLHLRGADGSGCDFFHAGLTDDLHFLLASPELAAYESIWMLGFSVGGHVVLKLATELGDAPAEARVKAVAAICSPLDLSATVNDFDRPWAWPYRQHVFRGLFAHYEQIARHRPVPTPLAALRKVSSLRQLDQLTVVPRFGFGTVENYYGSVSVGRRLDQLRRPALLVATEEDPMVTARSIRAGLAAAPPNSLQVAWSPVGGHVGFPPDTDLRLGRGRDFAGAMDEQVQGWLLHQA